jgi:hypothetical protein
MEMMKTMEAPPTQSMMNKTLNELLEIREGLIHLNGRLESFLGHFGYDPVISEDIKDKDSKCIFYEIENAVATNTQLLSECTEKASKLAEIVN